MPPVPPAPPSQYNHRMNPAQHPMDRLMDELVHSLILIVAREIDPSILSEMATLDIADPQLVAHLRQHNDAFEAKIRSRNQHPKAAGTPRRRQDGSIDKFNANDASARTRAIFEAALRRKGR